MTIDHECRMRIKRLCRASCAALLAYIERGDFEEIGAIHPVRQAVDEFVSELEAMIPRIWRASCCESLWFRLLIECKDHKKNRSTEKIQYQAKWLFDSLLKMPWMHDIEGSIFRLELKESRKREGTLASQ